MVLPDSHGVPRAPQYSGPPPNEPGHFRLRGSHPLWPVFPDRSTNVLVGNSSAAPYRGPVKAFNPEHTTHTGLAYARFRLVPFRSPLLGESRLLSSPSGTEMFHFPEWASYAYGFSARYHGIPRGELPHSGILGSRPAGGSPRLIAACYALHRLLMPGHPPYTLSSLTKFAPDTHSLLHAILQRSIQLSKNSPEMVAQGNTALPDLSRVLVELSGIEPPTPCLQSRCSPS